MKKKKKRRTEGADMDCGKQCGARKRRAHVPGDCTGDYGRNLNIATCIIN